MTAGSAVAPDAEDGRRWPRWFGTLFMVDLWERFGFYGMLAIFVLYGVDPVDEGGLGLPRASAAALFGCYLGLTFMFALPGGWIGDRVLGQQRAVQYGTVMVAIGHFVLAVPNRWFAPAGLLLVMAGTGLFKPNHHALVNVLAGNDGARRESAISALYIGVQVSALFAPLINGFLGERLDWHLGFAASGVAMTIGAFQYARGRKNFGAVGLLPNRPMPPAQGQAVARRTGYGVGAAVVLFALAAAAGAVTAQSAIILVGLLTLILPAACFTMVVRNPELTSEDRRKLRTLLWVFLGSGLFWMLVSQAGSLLNLFAKHSTDRTFFAFTLPASWLQAATPLCILVLAPILAWQFPKIGSRFGIATKFSVGLLCAGISFLLMSSASALAGGGATVSILWLLAVYLLHACGELVIAAVGISATAGAVGRAFMGQTLGLWWLFAALGGGLGSGVVRLIDVVPDPLYYLGLGLVATLVGVLFAVRRQQITAVLQGKRPAPSAPRPAHESV